MKRAAYALLMALFLTAIGLSIFIHKLLALDLPLLPAQAYDTWSVEARISLGEQVLTTNDQSAGENSVELALYLPQSSDRYQVLDESLEAENFASQSEFFNQISKTPSGENRIVDLSAQPPLDSNFLFYRAILRSNRTQTIDSSQQPSSVGQQVIDQQVEEAVRSSAQAKENLKENLPTDSVQSLIKEARRLSSNDFTLARQLYRLAIRSDDNRVNALQNVLNTGRSSVELTAFLLNEEGVVARVGNGLLLNPQETAASQFSQWLEVNQAQQWFAYDPVTEQFGAQTRYLTWWYGPGPVFTSKGVDNATIEVTTRPDSTDGLGNAILQDDTSSFFLKHSFFSLPLSTQRVIQVLVMIPIGALIVAALHQMVGISTFGTFTPVLIALSFRETGLLTGIALFSVVVVIGVLVRGLLNRVQLLVVPRLSAVLTVTVLVIGLLALLLDQFGLRYGLSISLFPIVILAMTIERAALMWEEDGAKETAIATAGSLFVAVIGFFCITNAYVQHLAFVFPELLLVVLAITVLLGRYNGYKLTEYFRFKALQKQMQQAES